jgi:adenosylhomocysteine nucleosidase
MGTGAIPDAVARRRSGVTGVVAALPAEARWLKASALSVRVGGVGAEPARRAATLLIADGAQALISWGMAAALAPMLSVGTLVLADRVIADAGALVPDVAWTARVADAIREVVPGVRVVRGTIACPTDVLRNANDKHTLADKTGAIAADMESAAIGSVAREAGAPWIVVRVVSDAADTVVPSSVVDAIDSTGALSLPRLLGGLLLNPGDMAALPALARGMRLAGRTARSVAPVLEGV